MNFEGDQQERAGSWEELTASAMQELRQHASNPTSRLIIEVEYHLVLAQLSPVQARSVRFLGYFDVPWPEQFLILRIHTSSLPTVDAFHARRGVAAEGGRRGKSADGGARREDWTAETYLLSWDVRFVRQSVDQTIEFPSATASPVGLARRVHEVHRRGAIRPFLEAATIVFSSSQHAKFRP